MSHQQDNNHLDQLIERFNLSPHPEGGWYKEVARSDLIVKRAGGEERSNITSILFLLGKSDLSCWHRVNHSDEIWIYLQGSPLHLMQLDPENKDLTCLQLNSFYPIHMVPAGYWQAAKSAGNYSLLSCCVGPGFDFDDFEMLRDLSYDLRPNKAMSKFI